MEQAVRLMAHDRRIAHLPEIVDACEGLVAALVLLLHLQRRLDGCQLQTLLLQPPLTQAQAPALEIRTTAGVHQAMCSGLHKRFLQATVVAFV